MPNYAKYYSAVKFWKKARSLKNLQGVGRSLLVPAFELFNAVKSRQTPRWAKAVAIGALGYLILPLDAVPDMVPGAGLLDDLLALMTAIQAIKGYVTPNVTRDANANVDNLLHAALGRTRFKCVAGPCARIASSLYRTSVNYFAAKYPSKMNGPLRLR